MFIPETWDFVSKSSITVMTYIYIYHIHPNRRCSILVYVSFIYSFCCLPITPQECVCVCCFCRWYQPYQKTAQKNRHQNMVVTLVTQDMGPTPSRFQRTVVSPKSSAIYQRFTRRIPMKVRFFLMGGFSMASEASHDSPGWDGIY